MTTKEYESQAERRKQRRLAKIGKHPVCLASGHTKWTGFQFHHIAGREYHEFGWYFSSSWHDDFSEELRSVPDPPSKETPSLLYIGGRFLIGLAIVLIVIAGAIETGVAQSAADSRHDKARKASPMNNPYLAELVRFLNGVAPACRDLGLQMIAEDGKQAGSEITEN
jgi:hypothetical protein